MFKRSTLSPTSRLYDQTSFYPAFERDISSAHHRIIIESPFITARRFYTLLPLIKDAVRHGVTVIVNTRNPDEHEPVMREQALECIAMLQSLDITVLLTAGLHRKIAVLDTVTWEGSLNILSQADSCEIMRRTQSPKYAAQLLRFTKLAKWYNEG